MRHEHRRSVGVLRAAFVGRASEFGIQTNTSELLVVFDQQQIRGERIDSSGAMVAVAKGLGSGAHRLHEVHGVLGVVRLHREMVLRAVLTRDLGQRNDPVCQCKPRLTRERGMNVDKLYVAHGLHEAGMRFPRVLIHGTGACMSR